jgi:Transposase DDE domain
VAASPDIGSQQPDASALPLGAGRLRQFLAYARKTFHLDILLAGVRDRRIEPRVSPALVARVILLLGVLRIRSFNALEPRLAQPWMQRALGFEVRAQHVCSVDTLAYSLSRADVPTYRNTVVQFVQKAERNKVFREGWHAALRVVALDGWEPFSSFERHCSACLTRQVKVKRNGEDMTLTQYYHSFVIAMLIDERFDLVIDMEAIRSADVRSDAGEPNVRGHEGELTAAKRLVPRLRATYGGWIDAVLGDALYANGPFLTVAKDAGLGVFVMLKKDTDEPLKDALAIWKGKPADKIVDAEKERTELWDCPGIETLSTYDGPIRVVRGSVIEKQDGTVHTWCVGITGRATRASAQQALAIARGRWHIENTAFHQFTHLWKFAHVFTHGPDAIPALFWIFFLAFNLLQLFLYRQLRSYGRDRGKDVTQTISRLVDEMIDDLARLFAAVAWDTS